MNKEKYIDKAFGLFQTLLVALMTALFGALAFVTLHFEEIDRIRLIIIGSGVVVLLLGCSALAFALAGMLKELKGD